MIADAGVLFVEATSYGMPFGVDLAIESDGLIWWTENSFARNPADEGGELCGVGLIVGLPQFLIEFFMRALIAEIPDLALQDRDLRVARIRGAQAIALVTEVDGIGWEAWDEIEAEAGRDGVFGRFRNSVSEELLTLSAGRRRVLRNTTLKFGRESRPICLPEIDERALRASDVSKIVLVERVDERDQDWKMVRVQRRRRKGAVGDVGD